MEENNKNTELELTGYLPSVRMTTAKIVSQTHKNPGR